MSECTACEHWRQIAYDGEDICMKAKDENEFYMIYRAL